MSLTRPLQEFDLLLIGYFLEQFWVHSNIEQKVEIYHLPTSSTLILQAICQQLYFNKCIIKATMNLLGYIAYIVNFFLPEMMFNIFILLWREENKK